MKTYEEMAQSALTRGKILRKQRRKSIKTHIGILSVLAACCLVFILTLGSRGAILDPNPTENLYKPTESPNSEITINYGQVSFLSTINKADTRITGHAYQYISGEQNPSAGSQAEAAPPIFEFQHGHIHVVAKAVEELGTYETLNEYGSTHTGKYRLFRLEVIEPLQSGLEGPFYYLLPAHLKGDLTQYDALLISMTQRPKNFVLQSEGNLTVFDYLFGDPHDAPELGNLIAFTNGIFDESLWQDRSWLYGYQFGKRDLDENDDRLLISRGSSLEEALKRRQDQIDEWGEWAKFAQVRQYNFQTETAQQLMTYLHPFENGVFVPEQILPDYHIRRYINGCPTNEWYAIDYESEEVTSSKWRFEEEDFDKLPDIATYISNLDLTQVEPQHTDTSGKVLIYNTAVGWYEKTEERVYSIIRIAWRYFDQNDSYLEYYDETFILLDETGDHIISREKLIGLIGENRNIDQGEYGVGIVMPMV